MSEVFETIKRNDYTFVVRLSREDDIPKIGEMAYSKVFPEEDIQSDESLELETDRWRGRYETYPDGLYVVEYKEKQQIVAAGGTQIINWNYGNPVPTWIELTDNGTIRGTHNPNGNTYHVVSHFVDRDYTDFGLGTALMKPRLEAFMQSPLQYMIVGHSVGRTNDKEFNKFKTYLGDISKIEKHELEEKIRSYATQMQPNPKTGVSEPIDPVTRFYYRQGFRFERVLVGFENYPEYNFQILQAIRK